MSERERELLVLADDLTMFASQIREYVADPRNTLPRKAAFDDWLYHYDIERYEAEKADQQRKRDPEEQEDEDET